MRTEGRNTRRRIIAAGLCAIVAAVGSVSAQTRPQPGKPLSPPAGALVAPGEPPSLTLFYTGDVIGYVDPCG
jgi:hypothetical protein